MLKCVMFWRRKPEGGPAEVAAVERLQVEAAPATCRVRFSAVLLLILALLWPICGLGAGSEPGYPNETAPSGAPADSSVPLGLEEHDQTSLGVEQHDAAPLGVEQHDAAPLGVEGRDAALLGVEGRDAALLGVEDILTGYNAAIRRTMAAIESLRVEQDLLEPLEDGKENRASAVLTYTRDGGMEREELESNIGHPTGEYTLASLVGPELKVEEYAISLAGVEDKDGRQCYDLEVSAIARDLGHFDGHVWVTVRGLHLVRVTGEVADPPFPVVKIGLDKAFEPVTDDLWLLRRHTGEVEVRLGFVKRHGMLHIFYNDYSVSVSESGNSGYSE
ncbi:MAG: hypothetical protein JXB46_03775 [Candidatus Eisenbacteria bacterium]|nr:hypothetical protein [Candidatus Eisenbacteria bacterium]